MSWHPEYKCRYNEAAGKIKRPNKKDQRRNISETPSKLNSDN
jgi:hypothetical protein